jgi:hypothetical protein
MSFLGKQTTPFKLNLPLTVLKRTIRQSLNIFLWCVVLSRLNYSQDTFKYIFSLLFHWLSEFALLIMFDCYITCVA